MVCHFNTQSPGKDIGEIMLDLVNHKVDLVVVTRQGNTDWTILARNDYAVNYIGLYGISTKPHSCHTAGPFLLFLEGLSSHGSYNYSFAESYGTRSVCGRNLATGMANYRSWTDTPSSQ
jgi:hypothetical protein